MINRILKDAACLLTVVLGVSYFICIQAVTISNKDGNLADMQLDNVQIEAQSIGSLFSDLSLSYNIPIGLEIALNDDELASYNIDFKKGTLSDLLTQFVAQHNQYDWEIKDGVVNIFPKDNYRDALFGELLETRISRFSVKEKTNCWVLVESLVATSEIKKILAANATTYRDRSFSGGYIPQLGRHFTLEVSNMTLRSILNRVIKESPTAKFWFITRNSSDHTFFMNLSARHEDVPMNNGKPIVLQQNFH